MQAAGRNGDRILSPLSGNLIALKRILFPGPFTGHLYNDEYARLAGIHALRPESQEERQQIIHRLQEGSRKPRHILDVGCSTGIPLDALCRIFGAGGTGVDVSEAAIAKARQDLPAYQYFHYDGERLPFERPMFDHVMMHHVLGHLRDPGRMLNEITRVLLPGGTLSIITTNAWYQLWRTPLNILNGFLPDPTVLRYYTAGGLRRLLSRHGMGIFNIFFWNPTGPTRRPWCPLRLIALAVKS